jgi:tetratricopeptide (TPR) repeat protein
LIQSVFGLVFRAVQKCQPAFTPLRYTCYNKHLMEDPKDIENFINEQKMRLIQKPDCAASLYNLGVALMQQGKFDEAIDAFEESIVQGVRMFEAFVNLGYIYFKDGDLDKVVKANQRAVELEPRYARGYANLGFAYLQMGKTDDAIDALEKALELNPEIVQAMCNLANAYLQKGDIEKSLEANRKMLELAPDFSLGYNNLANAYYIKGLFDEAVRNCDRARELGFEVHPDFLKLLEPHRSKPKKKATAEAAKKSRRKTRK